jgi:uncharacterized protein YprB with RNaseH-like and TPR domain
MYYYFDIETTGLHPNTAKIITFQYQALSSSSWTPVSELVIVKEWESDWSELLLLVKLKEMLIDEVWSFVPVGNNLSFDFSFISDRMRHYFGIDALPKLMKRPFLDLKHILVMMNGGSFRNYSQLIGKARLGANVPKWYEVGEYSKIIRYIEEEAEDFVRAYGVLMRKLSKLASQIY